MNTSHIAQADAKHKPLCQARARNDRQPRTPANMAHSGGMHPSFCDALGAAAVDTRITATEFRVLAIIGNGVYVRASIAKACGVSVPTIARAIAKLVSLGLLARQIVPGKASILSLPTRIMGDATAAETRITHDTTAPDDTTTRITHDLPTRITHDTRITGDTPAPVDNSSRACIEHAGARAQTLNLTTSRDSSSSERVLPSSTAIGRASSDRPPPPLWQRLADDVGSPWLDPNKSAGLVLKGGVIDSLAKAGADYALDILPTVRRLVATRTEPVHSWGYFVDAIRKAAAARLAAEAPMEIITPQEAKSNDHDRNRDADPGVRRRQRSLLTDRLMRTIAEGR